MSQTNKPSSNSTPGLAPLDSMSGGYTESATVLGHPVGLFLLFMVEMWERFSYYGMRGILVLYLTSPTTGMRVPPPGRDASFNPGRGWDDGTGNTAYGWYTGLAYLTPIIGGMIADKLIGTHKSMVVGGMLIALGHIVLGISGLGDMAHNAFGMSIFVFGLALIVIGTGHFKPSVSVMVGQLYKQGDPRRESAFGIFYMGINLGAALQTYIVGTLGEKYGWHWGFSAAAAGMIAGLLAYLFFREKFLHGIGLARDGRGKMAPIFLPIGIGLAAIVAFAYSRGMLGRFDTFVSDPRVFYSIAGVAVGWALYFTFFQNKREDWGPVMAIFIFMLFNAVFWLAFEQAGSSINLFTDRSTDRMIGSFLVPTTWFQSINPWCIIIFAPISGFLWTRLAAMNKNPSQPVKIGLGLTFVGLGYLFMVAAAMQAVDAKKASMYLIFATYFVHTIGEIILSPTGLSFVTKAAPKEHTSLLMGVWFISSFLANLGAGKVAAMVEPIMEGKKSLPWHLTGAPNTPNSEADFFFLFVITSCSAGVLIFILSPLLKKLIHGRE
ncbi:MAG: peptide MFS transporter [Planctomycetes bacterium]|nr:peptide MFS transporter [Planctomycetota bacterium]